MNNIIKFLLMLLLSSGLYAFNLKKPTILAADDAFNYSLMKKDNIISVTIDMTKGIYVYQDKITLKDENNALIKLDLPTAKKHLEDMVYYKSVTFSIPDKNYKKIKLTFQGCSEVGICYPPIKKEYILDEAQETPLKKITKTEQPKQSEENQIASLLQDSNIFLILATFFGFGLLLSLTPCIFPMIPILSSLIASQSGVMSAKRGFLLSLIYVLSMSVTYTLAGVLAGLFGANIQASFQNPWVISSFSLIFVILSLSMFDYFKIELPQSLQNYFNKKSENASGNGIASIAIMGFLSALIVGPCIAPPLAGALVYIGQTGDAFLGGAALFTLSIGMGVPLLVIGTAAGKYMPRPGGWMQLVTYIFGIIMLGVAIWMLSRIISDELTMILWALLALGSSIFFGALEPMGERNDKNFIKKFITFVLFLYGIALFFGALSGGVNPLKPLSGFGTTTSITQEKYDFEYVKNLDELQQKVKTSEQLVMVDFTAKWCISCDELEAYTFSDERVKREFKSMKILKVDVTDNNDADKKLQSHFGIMGPPALLFFKNGKEIQGSRIIGYKDADTFLKHLKNL